MRSAVGAASLSRFFGALFVNYQIHSGGLSGNGYTANANLHTVGAGTRSQKCSEPSVSPMLSLEEERENTFSLTEEFHTNQVNYHCQFLVAGNRVKQSLPSLLKHEVLDQLVLLTTSSASTFVESQR